jgi:hypothetical protein
MSRIFSRSQKTPVFAFNGNSVHAFALKMAKNPPFLSCLKNFRPSFIIFAATNPAVGRQ